MDALLRFPSPNPQTFREEPKLLALHVFLGDGPLTDGLGMPLGIEVGSLLGGRPDIRFMAEMT